MAWRATPSARTFAADASARQRAAASSRASAAAKNAGSSSIVTRVVVAVAVATAATVKQGRRRVIMIVCFIERANGSATRPGLEGSFRDGLRVPEALESRTVVWLGCKTRFF